MTSRTVLLMGPPGAGKGTQAAFLADRFSLRHVATGDLLREGVAAGTELGQIAHEFMKSGDLVPDDVIIGLLRELVATLPAGEGILLDGFPRTVAQAEALDTMLSPLSRQVDVALDIQVPASVLVDRLAGRWICRDCQRPYNVNSRPPANEGVCDDCGGELFQRADDTREAVQNRLDVYHKQTAPVSKYYEAAGALCPVNGDQAPEFVQAELEHAVESRTRNSVG